MHPIAASADPEVGEVERAVAMSIAGLKLLAAAAEASAAAEVESDCQTFVNAGLLDHSAGVVSSSVAD